MAHTLPKLPYAYDALEPFIDAKTVEIHHDKHHQTYVDNFNKAIAGKPELEAKSAEDLIANLNTVPEDIRGAVRNHGGGHINHALYWKIIGPKAGGEPTGDLAEAIKKHFGNFAAFKEKLENAAKTRFGSGWAWLVVDKAGKLDVTSTANQDSPLSEGKTPILTIDVWEHAYYLKYQNRRPEYITAFWNVINWEAVSKLYKLAKT
ncbi:MAG TPA: superoxide dismutase [Candidatus Omnitrophota bacterium]|nr:superoxide dismutase [Candidatus Omnitrophota bacterium]HPD85413.1 superoxide dismutase [Candidatus Omnitrophota bacterium]HRZ04086.1 superoxide dismutase [Candidatus Omnitrophota bacterium]